MRSRIPANRIACQMKQPKPGPSFGSSSSFVRIDIHRSLRAPIVAARMVPYPARPRSKESGRPGELVEAVAVGDSAVGQGEANHARAAPFPAVACWRKPMPVARARPASERRHRRARGQRWPRVAGCAPRRSTGPERCPAPPAGAAGQGSRPRPRPGPATGRSRGRSCPARRPRTPPPCARADAGHGRSRSRRSIHRPARPATPAHRSGWGAGG